MGKKYNALMAGLMLIALSACGTTDRNAVVNAREVNSGEMYGEVAGNTGLVTGPAIAASAASQASGTPGSSRTSGASGMSGSSGMSGTSGASGASDTSGASGSASPATSPGMSSGSADLNQSSAMTSYGVIQSIDAIPRAQAFGMAGAGTTGSSVSGGSGAMTGSGSAGDMVYRLTMRMDDGSTRAVIQESRPGFQTGDRVRMASSMLQRY